MTAATRSGAEAGPRRIPRYADSLDFQALWDEFPPAPEYFEGVYRASRDELHALQEKRFLAQVERGWQIPFYQRHWGKAGIARGDIRSLEQLRELPPFSVHDLRESLASNPPWGEFSGIDPLTHEPLPLVLQTSGGTTGLPRPMLFAPRDREVMNIITGRRLYMQGVRPFDLVQVALATGLTNGGLLAREGIWKYTGAVPVMTGSGAQTPSRRQVELMQAWKVKVLVGFAPYLRKLGLVARDEMGIDPRELGIKSVVAHLGLEDRASLEELWAAPVYDTYGANEFGSIAAECEHRSGMHVFEDAFVAEVVDSDTGQEAAAGARGVLHLTTLFKYAAPMIRFNTNDISSWLDAPPCPCGSCNRRISKLFGRADNMVKLRGTNLFPEAVGALVAEHALANGEYVCIVDKDAGGREDMQVMFEFSAPVDASTARRAEAELAQRIKEALGVKLSLKGIGAGELEPLTGLSASSKVRRLIDRR